MDRWPICSYAGSPTFVLLACNVSITTASAVGFVLEIPCRATLAKAARRASLAARFLGYPVETRGKLRRQVAVCGRKPGAGQFGDKSRRLAIPGRDECVDLVTRNRMPWRALLRKRRGFPCTGADPFDRNGAGLRPARVGRHGGRPSNIPRTRRGSAYRKPWRAILRQRPFFPRASVALSDGWGRGFAPRKSDDTEVVPPRPPQPPVCQLSGSASKHGISSAFSFRLFFGEFRKVSFPNCGPDGSRS